MNVGIHKSHTRQIKNIIESDVVNSALGEDLSTLIQLMETTRQGQIN